MLCPHHHVLCTSAPASSLDLHLAAAPPTQAKTKLITSTSLMMLFAITVAASLACLGSTASSLPGTQTLKRSNRVARACAPLSSPTAPYTIVASKPNSPIHYLPVNAGPDYLLVLGGDPDSTPCPLQDQSACPPGAYTAFAGFGSLVSLIPIDSATQVPGPSFVLGERPLTQLV